MKIWGYFWRVVVNLITLFVVINIFDIASTNFEIAIFAILILIYQSIASFASSWGLFQMHFGEALQKELDAIKGKLGINLYDDDYTEEYKNDLEKEKKEKKDNTMIKFYINVGFQFIIYIFVLYKLISIFS